MKGKSVTSVLPRLIAEFVVIVVGVLVALGVDSWVSDARDRELEREYLQRLLDDVQYDLRELAFLDAVGRVGLSASLSLTSLERVAGLEPSILVGMVAAAANERQPDLSRGTYRELLSSGRIDLIRASSVRTALAEYDRVILETQGIWEHISPNLRTWSLSRIPPDVIDRRAQACGSDPDAWLYNVPTACEFDMGDWSARQLARDVVEPETQRRMLLATHRFRSGLRAGEQLRVAAEGLVAALESALSSS